KPPLWSRRQVKPRDILFRPRYQLFGNRFAADRDVRSLSRGENQRIVIARALLSSPRLLLLDEPLTALDAKLKETILQQLRSLHQEFGIPMLYVTHDPVEAIEICEEVLILESGRVLSRGEPRELLG